MERKCEGCVSREDVVVVPKDLECLICGDLYENAVSVEACGHTFCSVCFRIHYREAREKRCPLCKISVTNDIRRVLVMNRAMQIKVNEFNHNHSLVTQSSRFRSAGFGVLEAPIRERMQSRNYSMLLKSGKKELQRICKEYKLPSSGSGQDLVGRLRYFQCMWDAELDTIDTPLTPSELAAKFKRKERLQREEKSRGMITGSINDMKHMKKLTASLLDDNARNKVRNDKKVCVTSSGNVMFDIKFRENFATLIAQGRKHMKKGPGCPRRIYNDDHIHDKPAPTTNSVDNDDGNDGTSSEMNDVGSNAGACHTTTALPIAGDTRNVSNELGNGASTTIESSMTTNRSSPNSRKRSLNDPRTEERKKPCLDESLQIGGNDKISEQVATNTTAISKTTRRLGSSKPIINPYKKNRQKTLWKAMTATCLSSRENNSLKSPIIARNGGNQTPIQTLRAQGSVNNSQDEICSRPPVVVSQSDTPTNTRIRPTPRKSMIRNPYLKSCSNPKLGN
eukprot:CAMPEP_0172405254 /NCGR_PEP_ID=MMETSP1061-20121228/66506_1 /TAXON_ID=37318 /ORGANISM="Pseudo-nitzschia pungens, Strain cf. pungens" /LENGTH=506 /DNA_ID=CAMNT_0013140423 /DNA_START=70 /DNA_END=1590 /DNA_ORIENTATION=+